ncbi:MAG: DUF4367 domain-containing protein [Angelakisella sp.]
MKNTKKLLIVALSLLIVSGMAACGSKPAEPIPTHEPMGQSESQAQIPSPLVTYKTAEELEAAVGFSINAPTYLPEGYTANSFTAIGSKLAEIRYQNGEKSITFRMAEGDEDVSGDYNQYSSTQSADVAGTSVSLKGDGETVALATFARDGFSYSLSFESGVQQAEAVKIIESIYGAAK